MMIRSGKDWRKGVIIIDGFPIYPLGYMIRGFLLAEGEMNPYGIYKLAQELKARHAQMPQFKYSYGTIRNYFYWLHQLGYITPSRTEPSSKANLQPKQFYELTPKGRRAQDEWFNVSKTYLESLPR